MVWFRLWPCWGLHQETRQQQGWSCEILLEPILVGSFIAAKRNRKIGKTAIQKVDDSFRRCLGAFDCEPFLWALCRARARSQCWTSFRLSPQRKLALNSYVFFMAICMSLQSLLEHQIVRSDGFWFLSWALYKDSTPEVFFYWCNCHQICQVVESWRMSIAPWLRKGPFSVCHPMLPIANPWPLASMNKQCCVRFFEWWRRLRLCPSQQLRDAGELGLEGSLAQYDPLCPRYKYPTKNFKKAWYHDAVYDVYHFFEFKISITNNVQNHDSVHDKYCFILVCTIPHK